MAYTKATKDGLLPAVRPSRQNTKDMQTLDGYDRHINLNNLDVHNLVAELTTKYNQNNDVGIIRNWFRRNKIESQDKHLQSLLSMVRQVREHSTDLIEFKANLMSQQQLLHHLITGKIEHAAFAVDRQREEHQTFLMHQVTERNRAIEELERIRIDNKHRIAETRLVNLRGDLIEKITKELDLDHISPPQAFVLIKALNQENTESDVFMAEGQLEQMKAEAKLKNAEARMAEQEAEYEKFKMNESMKSSDV